MSIHDKLFGVIPALATPLTYEGTIDVLNFKKLIRNVLTAGCNGIMILGSAGEGIVLDSKNYSLAVETAVTEVNGKYPVIVGAGDVSTEGVYKKSDLAFDLGADAILVVPQCYFPIPQIGVENFYRRLADRSKLPVMIYNIPALTKIEVGLETVMNLSTEENIVGMKDSSGDFAYFQRVLAYAQSSTFKVFQGRAPFFLASVLMGADGTQGPIPNIAPQLELGIHSAVKEGNLALAKQCQNKISEIAKMFGYSGYPVSMNLKGIMAAQGICEKYTADPIPVLEDEIIEQFGDKFRQIMLNS
ncbi:MAG TPA: dihydrodipicolinate synthase family protein [Desulfosporosinus sp.]|nr:dihydrodipicolinate synthase family protein [Desulfosporosinus sp.]